MKVLEHGTLNHVENSCWTTPINRGKFLQTGALVVGGIIMSAAGVKGSIDTVEGGINTLDYLVGSKPADSLQPNISIERSIADSQQNDLAVRNTVSQQNVDGIIFGVGLSVAGAIPLVSFVKEKVGGLKKKSRERKSEKTLHEYYR